MPAAWGPASATHLSPSAFVPSMAQAKPLGDAVVSLKQTYAGRPVHGQCAFRTTLANNRADGQKAFRGSTCQRTEPAPGGTRAVPIVANRNGHKMEHSRTEPRRVATLTSMWAVRRLPQRKRARTCKAHTFTQVGLAGLRTKAITSTFVPHSHYKGRQGARWRR